MEINHLRENDLPQLYEFYKLIHPDNTAEEIKAYVDHWLAKVPDAMEYVSIQKENEEIVGLDFNTPMSFWLSGQKYNSGWGFDLYVKDKYREANYGVDLLLYNKKKFPNNFATGSNPTAVKILAKMGAKQIGEIHKYVGVANILDIFTSIIRGCIPNSRYPQNIAVGGKHFKRIKEDELPEIATPYNDKILEINHNADFLRWKFFNSYNEYAFYLDVETNNYIVFRTIRIKHISLLMISDYRCNVSSTFELESLYQVAKKVARIVHVAFIFFGSSLSCTDKIFEKHHCHAIGRHRPIMTFDKTCKDSRYKESIANRNFVLITLSDSDGEPI